MNRRNLIAGIVALPLLALPGGEQASAAKQHETCWTIRTDAKGYPVMVEFHADLFHFKHLRALEEERFRLWADALNAEYYSDNPIPFYE